MMGCVGLGAIAVEERPPRHAATTADAPDAAPRTDGGLRGATVLLDTNVLMAPIEADVRVFEELERLLDGGTYLVPRAARDELDALAAAGTGDEPRAAAVGADLADERCRIVDHEATSADDAILELADGVDLVATSDGPLRDRLLDAGVSVVSLRATNKLAITHP